MTPEDLKLLDVDSLLDLRAQIDALLSEKREQLKHMLEKIEGAPRKSDQIQSSSASAQKRRSDLKKPGGVAPQYRSKKNPSVTWTGRGMTPRWMRAEMAGTKLKKEDFRI